MYAVDLGVLRPVPTAGLHGSQASSSLPNVLSTLTTSQEPFASAHTSRSPKHLSVSLSEPLRFSVSILITNCFHYLQIHSINVLRNVLNNIFH